MSAKNRHHSEDCLYFTTMTLTWHCLVALAVLAPVAYGACKKADPFIGAVSTSLSTSYAVVIDAGSSGSRIRVYSWEDEKDLQKLPNIREVYCYAKDPGVSDCATPQEITNHILELVGKAANYVPANVHHASSIYFMATAGKSSYLVIVFVVVIVYVIYLFTAFI